MIQVIAEKIGNRTRIQLYELLFEIFPSDTNKHAVE